MKFITGLVLLLVLSSCEFRDIVGDLIEETVSAPRDNINRFLGKHELESEVEANKAAINSLNDDADKQDAIIATHNRLINILMKDIADLQSDIDEIGNDIGDIQDDVIDLYNMLYMLTNRIDDLDIQDSSFNSELSNINTQLDYLDNLTNQTVTELIDPCGNSGGYDEILIKLNDGSILGYFEVGAKRFLSELKDGVYKTTDNQGCNFRIVDGVYSEI